MSSIIRLRPDMSPRKYTVEDVPKKQGCFLGVRHLQIVLISCLAGICFGKNVNFSVAVVAMTNTNDNSDIPTYNWTDTNLIISSYYWLTFPFQIAAGVTSEKYGSKWLLAIAALVSSTFTAALPLMAQFGSWGVMICRIIQGATQAMVFPAAFNLIVKWVPVPERTRLCNIMFTGSGIGTIISMSLSGIICASTMGWPLVFYVSGAVGYAWLILWIIFGSNSPQDHPWISDKEKEYIVSSQGTNVPVKTGSTPWLAILKSMPMWAIFVGNCSFNWGFFMLLSQIPTYLNAVFEFEISSNGLLSALPYIVNCALSNFLAAIFDYVINQNILSTTKVRKLATSIGVFGPAAALIILAAFGKQATATMIILLLVIAVGVNAAITSGFMMNCTDISPNYAATVNAITNGGSIIFSIVGPIAVHVVVTDNTNVYQWGLIFYITATFYLVAGIFYIVFGSAEVQAWNSGETKKELSAS